MQSFRRNLCISTCLMLQTELQRCQPCACGKAMVHLRVAQVARVAHAALQHSLAQVALMVMPQQLGPAERNALVMQLWLATMGLPGLRGFGQELLEHFLQVNEALMDPV